MKMSAHDDVGSGFPIVLIQGHPFNRSVWAPQIDFLRSSYRVIAPDLGGYGGQPIDSDKTLLSEFAADIAELVDRLGIDRFILGGLSMGGQIALECYR
ncbi:MAG TPA: alpha/beta fold hydrolase [Terriglobales bacterium]|nr:alpha/beta fold hydrolase [Terriglobales bacterium]